MNYVGPVVVTVCQYCTFSGFCSLYWSVCPSVCLLLLSFGGPFVLMVLYRRQSYSKSRTDDLLTSDRSEEEKRLYSIFLWKIGFIWRFSKFVTIYNGFHIPLSKEDFETICWVVLSQHVCSFSFKSSLCDMVLNSLKKFMIAKSILFLASKDFMKSCRVTSC